MSEKIKKTICVVDASILGSASVDLANYFETVYYCAPHYDPYPKIDREKIMEGLDNVIPVSDYHKVMDECDILYFPDGGFEDVVDYWMRHGKKVIGSGNITWLENERWRARKEFIKLGLPQIKAVKIVGVDDLRDYLETVEDKYIKVTDHRGSWETHHHIDFFLSEYWINQILLPQLGAKGEEEVFVVEDTMPGIEIGIDTFSIDGEWSDKCLIGFEVKDAANVSKIIDYEKAPDEIRDICSKLSPLLKEGKYRNQLSLEIRIGKEDKKYYLTDPCLRQAIPAGALFRNVISNYGEMIMEGSEGKLIPATTVSGAKYGVELMMHSETAKHSNLPIEIPEDIFPFVKLKTFMKKDGNVYECIPFTKSYSVGSIIAWGDTLDECIALVEKRFDAIKCYDLEVDLSSLKIKAKKIIEDAQTLGVDF